MERPYDQSCSKSPTGVHEPVEHGQNEIRHGWTIPMKCKHCDAQGWASVSIAWDPPAKGKK